MWAADFSPNENVDFGQLLSRSFSELELPEEPGWGPFAPTGNYLEIQVRVTDRQGRLGRVEFRNAETWQLVGSIWASSSRAEASGMFSIPADLRGMVAEVLTDTGRGIGALPTITRQERRYFLLLRFGVCIGRRPLRTQ